MSRAFFLLALVALLPAVAVLAQGSARLLVQKSLDHHTSMPHNFAINSPINVSITIINAGDATAYDLVLEDSWGQTGMFEVEAGKGTGPYKFEELLPGQSVNVQYFVEPKQTGPFESSPARVLYTPTAGGRPQTAYSSSTTNLNVIDSALFAKLTNTHSLEWGLFAGMIALFIVAPAFKWYELSSSYVKGGRRSKAE